MFTTFDKFLAAIIGPTVTSAILGSLAPLGINGSTTVNQVVTILVGAILVWLVPNKPS